MNWGDITVGVFVGVLGLVGLVLAGGALDQEIYLFGLGLFAFAVVFDWGLMLKAIRRAEAARARTHPHG
jgi:4-hydroxybenzoate polyprenyltransferase